MRVVVFIDGGFFLKRYRKLYSADTQPKAKKVCKDLYTYVHKHLDGADLYRVFYYDCAPLLNKIHHPITGKCIDFSKTPQAHFRLALFEELKKQRKVALRLGNLRDGQRWIIKPAKLKALLKGEIDKQDLKEEDLIYDTKQKGIDTKIGVDIASIAYKKHADRMVLIAGDRDFVPAAKLARREGIDFVLDPMWNPINPELFEHIDGLKSCCPKPVVKKKPR